MMMDGAKNGCSYDCPVLQTHFIRRHWLGTAGADRRKKVMAGPNKKYPRGGLRRDRRKNKAPKDLHSSGRTMAEEHKDAPYVVQLGLVVGHKSLCSSGTWPGRGI
jgi:hypothetical protein